MSLRGRTITAVGWTTGAKVAQLVFQFGLSAVLMRLLGPKAFGLIGMIMVFSGFVAIFSELGFSAALVQRQDLREDHRSTVFWFNMGMAGVLALLMYLAAPLVAQFYSEPLLKPMTAWLSLCFLLSAPGMVPRTLLQKALRFEVLAKVQIASLVLSGGTAIAVAAARGGVWSLVVQQLVSAVAGSALVLWLGGWYPQPLCSRQALRELFRYGANFTGFNIINYWARNVDNLLIGKFMSSEALGLYSRAYSLMLLPLTQIVGVIGPVMFPALSSIQDDKARVRRAFLRVITLLTFVTFPMMLGLVVVAKPFVLGLYGDRWGGMIPIVQILAFVGVTQTLCNPTGWIYTSQGRTDWMFWWGLGGSGFLILCIIVGMALGTLKAVAMAYLVGNLIITGPCIAIPGRLIGMTLIHVWRAIKGNFYCALAMAAAVWCAGAVMPSSTIQLVRLVLLVTVGALAYGILVWGSRQPALAELSEIRNRISRRRGSETDLRRLNLAGAEKSRFLGLARRSKS
jgi:O-antigen/teichoic acid export membrane protein